MDRLADSHPSLCILPGISAPSTQYPVYPAGPSFIAQARRDILNLSWEEDDKIQAKLHHEKLQAKAIEAGEELYPGLGEEVEEKHVLAYDPKEWKVCSPPVVVLFCPVALNADLRPALV